MDDEIKMMLNTIIDEMGRVEEKADKRFEKNRERVRYIAP